MGCGVLLLCRSARRVIDAGLVVEPAAFDDALGLSETGGWFYAVIGAVSAITGMISPTIVSRR